MEKTIHKTYKLVSFGCKEWERLEDEANEPVFTSKEVADECGVHKGTLLKWIRDGLVDECVMRSTKQNARAWTLSEFEAIRKFARKRHGNDINA